MSHRYRQHESSVLDINSIYEFWRAHRNKMSISSQMPLISIGCYARASYPFHNLQSAGCSWHSTEAVDETAPVVVQPDEPQCGMPEATDLEPVPELMLLSDNE